MILIRIHVLPFIFDKVYSTLSLSSALVAPGRWLRFAAETCRSSKTACAVVSWEKPCVFFLSLKSVHYFTTSRKNPTNAHVYY